MYFSTVQGHYQNDTQNVTGRRWSYPPSNNTYSIAKLHHWETFANTGFRSWIPSRCPGCSTRCLVIYIHLRRYFGTTNLSGPRTSEVRPSRITPRHSISLQHSDLSPTSKKTTYVLHYKTSFFLASLSRRRTQGMERELLMCAGYISTEA